MFDTIEKPLNLFTWATVTYPKITINFIALSVHSDLLTLIKCRPFWLYMFGKLAVITWFQVVSIEPWVRAAFHSKWWSSKSSVFYSFRRRLCKAHVCNLISLAWHILFTFKNPGPASLIRFHYVFLYVPEGGGVLVHLNVTSSLSSLVPVKTRISERSLNLALKARLITYLLTDCVISSQRFPVRFLFWLESKKRLRGCLFYKIELTAP